MTTLGFDSTTDDVLAGADRSGQHFHAATSPDLDDRGAVYLEDCHIAEVTDDPADRAGVRAYAVDPVTADALWELSERLVG